MPLTSCELSSKSISSPSSTLKVLGVLYIFQNKFELVRTKEFETRRDRKIECHAKAAWKIFVENRSTFDFIVETRSMPKQNQSQLILLSPRGRLLRVNERLTTCCFGMPLVECKISCWWVAPRAFFSVAR